MGITGEAGLLWKSFIVKSEDICNIVNQQFQEYKKNNNNDCDSRDRPKIVIDPNEVGNKFISKGASKCIIAIASSFTEAGIDSAIVCDNQKTRQEQQSTERGKG